MVCYKLELDGEFSPSIWRVFLKIYYFPFPPFTNVTLKLLLFKSFQYVPRLLLSVVDASIKGPIQKANLTVVLQ